MIPKRTKPGRKVVKSSPNARQRVHQPEKLPSANQVKRTVNFSGYRLCRFRRGTDVPRPGLLQPDGGVMDLAAGGIDCLFELLEKTKSGAAISAAQKKGLPTYPATRVTLLPPVDAQEIWAAGVT